MPTVTPTELTLITIDLSFHTAAAAVVQALLARHGVRCRAIHAPHERAFELLRQGEGDLLCAAWLPGSHGDYLAPFAHDVERLAVLYTPYALWGVPDYVPSGQVAQLADLARPDVAARMDKHIQGIGPGAGISRFSREIMAHYGLEQAGYRFSNGTLEQCVAAYEQAVAAQRWVVLPLWQPQFLHGSHRIRSLADPTGLLRGRDEATLLLRKDRAGRLPPAALDALRALHLGNDRLSWLDHLIMREHLSPAEAAARLAQASA